MILHYAGYDMEKSITKPIINRYADISQSLAATEPAIFCEETCEAGTQDFYVLVRKIR